MGSPSVGAKALLDLGPDITPRAVVGDKGYASKGNRALARERGYGAAMTDIDYHAN